MYNSRTKMANKMHHVHVKIAPSPRCKSCTPRQYADPQNIKASACLKILSVLGHKSLDEKLLQHDIRRKRSKSSRIVRNLMSKSLQDVKNTSFGREDLEKLSVEQLKALRKSFEKKLLEKRREQAQVLELNEKETKLMIKTTREKQNIELAAKTTLKPYVNVLPDSDDMARVMLLN